MLNSPDTGNGRESTKPGNLPKVMMVDGDILFLNGDYYLTDPSMSHIFKTISNKITHLTSSNN